MAITAREAEALTSTTSLPQVVAFPHDRWLYRVRCPWCHSDHYHGRAGGYGFRIAHCNGRYDGLSRSYVLVPWEEAARD